MRSKREGAGGGKNESGGREEVRKREGEERKVGGEGSEGEVSVKCLKYCL